MIRVITLIVLFYSAQLSAGNVRLHVSGEIIKAKALIIPNCNGSARAYIYNRFGVTHIVFASGATPKIIKIIDNIMKSKGEAKALRLKCPAREKHESEYQGTGIPA